MKLIFACIRRHTRMFLAAILFLTLEAAADLLQPAMMSRIVDEGVARLDARRILAFGGMMLGIALVGALGACARNVISVRTAQAVGRELRAGIYGHVMGLSLENIDRLHPASIITRITNDVTQIQDFITQRTDLLFKNP